MFFCIPKKFWEPPSLLQETPSPTASPKGKGNYERVTPSAGSTITESMIGGGRFGDSLVMGSSPTCMCFFQREHVGTVTRIP